MSFQIFRVNEVTGKKKNKKKKNRKRADSLKPANIASDKEVTETGELKQNFLES